jgi:hypothetical protein
MHRLTLSRYKSHLAQKVLIAALRNAVSNQSPATLLRVSLPHWRGNCMACGLIVRCASILWVCCGIGGAVVGPVGGLSNLWRLPTGNRSGRSTITLIHFFEQSPNDYQKTTFRLSYCRPASISGRPIFAAIPHHVARGGSSVLGCRYRLPHRLERVRASNGGWLGARDGRWRATAPRDCRGGRHHQSRTNIKHRLAEMLSRRAMALARHLQIHARATRGEARQAARQPKGWDDSIFDDGLLARPMRK